MKAHLINSPVSRSGTRGSDRYVSDLSRELGRISSTEGQLAIQQAISRTGARGGCVADTNRLCRDDTLREQVVRDGRDLGVRFFGQGVQGQINGADAERYNEKVIRRCGWTSLPDNAVNTFKALGLGGDTV